MTSAGETAFTPPPTPQVAISGARHTFPVHRIYCVGRNYAGHVREMGKDPAKEPPFFFMKPADAVVAGDAAIPFPPRTHDFQHEVELVVAIGKAGSNVSAARALEHVHGYAVGNDYTRRDLQMASRNKGWPWDTGKGFDNSAAIGTIHPVSRIGHLRQGRVWLTVNGTLRQEGDIANMLWDVPMIVAELSTLFALQPGDLIYTGTPAGVASITPGDVVVAGIDGLGVLRNTIAPPLRA